VTASRRVATVRGGRIQIPALVLPRETVARYIAFKELGRMGEVAGSTREDAALQV